MSFVFANFLKSSWWNAVYTAVTCRFVVGFIQTSPCSSFPDFVHRKVPWKCLDWFVFKYSIPVKDGLQRASPVEVIAHPFSPIKLYFLGWNLVTLTFMAFWRFFSSCFCSSKSFCNSHRTVRQRHGEDEWIPSPSSEFCNNCTWQSHLAGNGSFPHPTASLPMQISREPARMNFASPFPSSQGRLSL